MIQRVTAVFLFAAVLGAHPGSPPRQPKPPIPTHQWDFQTAASVSPQRGGSTGTFTRTGSSSCIGSDGFYAVLANNNDVCVSRPLVKSSATLTEGVFTQPTTGQQLGLRILDAETFELLNNTDLSNASWTAIGTPAVTVNQNTDPWGATSLDRITDNDGAGDEGVEQTVTLSTNSAVDWSATAWVRCTSPHDVVMQLDFNNDNLISKTVACTNTPQMVIVRANNSTTQATATVTLYAASLTDADTGSADWGYVNLWAVGASHIHGDEPSVAGSALTRNVEALSYSSISFGTSGTWCSWIWYDATTSTPVFFAWDGTTNFEVNITSSLTINAAADTASDDASVISSTTVAEYEWEHLCVVWTDGSQLDLFLNGVEVSYGTNDETWTAGGNYGTTMLIGDGFANRTGGTIFFSRMKKWDTRVLNAGQIKGLYQREKGKYE